MTGARFLAEKVEWGGGRVSVDWSELVPACDVIQVFMRKFNANTQAD